MKIRAVLIMVAATAVATPVSGQAWGSPTFLPPSPGDDIGLYLTDMDGVDLGFQGIWRQQGNLNLGLRVGFLDTNLGDDLITVGVETWDRILQNSDLPVDVAWTLGAGAAFGDGTFIGIPVGLTIGRVIDLDGIAFQLYGHPRLSVEIASFNDNTDTDLDGLFDLGADVYLGDAWKLRLGATIGGPDAVGVGLAYRFTRGVAVR